MSFRLIELFLPVGYSNVVKESLTELKVLDLWQDSAGGDRAHMKILVSTGQTESILDHLEKNYSHMEGFRIVLLPVEASLPRPKEEEKNQVEKKIAPPAKPAVSRSIRISREELYDDIKKTVGISWVFFAMIIFSSIVASVGILRDNVVFIIGAMVIAPLLGSNVALSLATTLGDIELSRKAFRAIGLGILLAVVSSMVIGTLFNVNPEIAELQTKTEVSLADIVIALVAGSAAVLSFTSGLLSALIGVMVAVALLPPLVVFGMLVASGQWELARGAIYLFLVNFICVNLAGVVTFLVQGIRPLTWWEASKAKRATGIAILIWVFLLAVLVLVISLST